MYKFEFYDKEDLSDEIIDSLWKQKIEMDDWDYLIFFENEDFLIKTDDRWRPHLEPENYYINNLLHGSYKNTWYFVENFTGRKGVLGIAYHA